MHDIAGADVVEASTHLLGLDTHQLRPGKSVDRELEGIGVLLPVRLPVHHLVPVRGLVDGIDAPFDNLAAEHQGERSLDLERGPVAVRASLECSDELLELGVSLDVEVGSTGQVTRFEKMLLAADVCLDPGVKPGPEACERRRPARHRARQVSGQPVGVVLET